MSFTPIGDTLGDKFQASGPLKKQVEASQVVEYAQEAFIELFGEKNGALARPLFLKNRTLTVTCATSSVAQEIRLRQGEIVESINKKLGKKEVDRIRYLA